MSKDQQSHPGDRTPRGRTPWFAANRYGAGYHPRTWQGWLVMAVGVAVIVTAVVLFRTGVL